MSSMKQVVYAGAFGALVAMQGCGDAETPQVDVTAEGQTLKQEATEIIKTAEERIAHFDANATLKQVEEIAKSNNIDVDTLKEKMGEYSSMNADQMSAKAHEAVENLMADANLQHQFADAKKGLESIFAEYMGELTYEQAEIEVKAFCSKEGAKKATTNQEAKKFVMALETLYTKTNGKDNYSQEVDTLLTPCKAGFQWKDLPCFSVKYTDVSVAAIKAKQNLDQPEPKVDAKADAKDAKADAKDAKKPAKKVITKDIYAVMPKTLAKVTDASAVFKHIEDQIMAAAKVERVALMQLAQAVRNNNLVNKPKPAAKKAVVKGAKVAEEKKALLENEATKVAQA
jgi:hypothetical protein